MQSLLEGWRSTSSSRGRNSCISSMKRIARSWPTALTGQLPPARHHRKLASGAAERPTRPRAPPAASARDAKFFVGATILPVSGRMPGGASGGHMKFAVPPRPTADVVRPSPMTIAPATLAADSAKRTCSTHRQVEGTSIVTDGWMPRSASHDRRAVAQYNLISRPKPHTLRSVSRDISAPHRGRQPFHAMARTPTPRRLPVQRHSPRNLSLPAAPLPGTGPAPPQQAVIHRPVLRRRGQVDVRRLSHVNPDFSSS